MIDTFDKLQKLQLILGEKYKVEEIIEGIAPKLQTKNDILVRMKHSFQELNEKYEGLQVESRTLKLEMESISEEREELEKKMDSIKTQREYEALDKEIAGKSQIEQQLRRNVHKIELQLSELAESIVRDKDMITNQELELEQDRIAMDVDLGKQQKELARLAREEKKIIPGLDEEVLFKFDRILRNKEGLGIVPVVKNTCSGCYMLLPAQYVYNVRVEDSINFCPYCSRILYYEEETENKQDFDVISDEKIGGLADLVDSDFSDFDEFA